MSTSLPNEKRHWTDYVGLHVPVGIMLAIYFASNWMQLDAVSRAHRQLAAATKELARDDVKRQLGNAQKSTQMLQSLAQEVSALAPTNANARKIADEFHMPVPAAPSAPVSDAGKAAPQDSPAVAAAAPVSAPTAKP